MHKDTLAGIVLVLIAAGICFTLFFAMVFGAFKKDLSPAQAQALAQEYLTLAAEDFETFAKKKQRYAFFKPAELKTRLETYAFERPHGTRVAKTTNRVRMSGMDFDSISDVAGTFLCGDDPEAKDFRIRFFYEETANEWLVMDFFVESCQAPPAP